MNSIGASHHPRARRFTPMTLLLHHLRQSRRNVDPRRRDDGPARRDLARPPGAMSASQAQSSAGARPCSLRRPASSTSTSPAPHGVRRPARARRHAVPARRLAGARPDPVRRDTLVRRAGGPDRAAGGRARGRGGERPQPGLDRAPLPPRRRRDGALRGFGGGLDVKEWLLAHERAAIRLSRHRRVRSCPVTRSVVVTASPEEPASPARAGRNRGTWEGVLSAASFRT